MISICECSHLRFILCDLNLCILSTAFQTWFNLDPSWVLSHHRWSLMHWVSLWIFKPDVIWIHPELCHIVGDLLLQLRDILLCCHIVGVGYQRHLGPNTKFKSRFELSENYQTIIKELSGNYQNIIRKLTGNYKRIINYQGIIRDTIDQMPNSSQESNDLRSPQRIWECLWQCWGG